MMNPLKVLIVEDEAIISMSLAAILKRLGHQIVGREKDGREASKKAEKLNPDIIIMDIKMQNKKY